MKTASSGHINASTKRTINLLAVTLLSLLEKQSLEKITIMDICKTAQVPRATFYNHFEDKYDLLRFSLKSIADELRSAVPPELENEEKIVFFINNLLDFTEQNYKFLKRANSANYNSVLFSEIKNIFYEDLLTHIRDMREKGFVFTADEKIIAEFFSNAIVYSAKTWLEQDMEISREDTIKSFMVIYNSCQKATREQAED
ncbi:MAG: TetR/AcrR family transcriptional regulator [Clostridiales bacterium]|nr:TetR/AcrR family transcriptional regulator [Clostridiales bacterium]